MKRIYLLITLLFLIFINIIAQYPSDEFKRDYLKYIKAELQVQWPKNQTINFVFHGHSVPAGYFKTPVVNPFGSYPLLFLKELKNIYPYAVVNAINTSIGGEASESGSKRFKKDVLIHRPDVIFIDYSLNEQGADTSKVKGNWEKMIKQALKRNIKVFLCTPTPDQRVNILQQGNNLEKHTVMLRNLAKRYKIGLIDSYSVFLNIAKSGGNIADYMSQVNHPNEKGHTLVVNEILKYLEK